MGAKGAVTGIVAVGLVAVGAYVADGLARGSAEETAEQTVRQQVQVDGDLDVRIEGFPFLTQLARGSFDDVRATATSVVLDGLTVTDVTADLRGASLEAPYRVRDVTVEATVPTATVQQVVDERTSLDVGVEGDALRATGDVLGLEIGASLVPRVQDGRLLVDVEEVTLGAATVDVTDLPGGLADRLQGVEVPVEGLPEGVRLTGATVVPQGIRITAAGTDVALEDLS